MLLLVLPLQQPSLCLQEIMFLMFQSPQLQAVGKTVTYHGVPGIGVVATGLAF